MYITDEYASQVPPSVLSGLRTTGTIQIIVGCIGIYACIHGYFTIHVFVIELICAIVSVPLIFGAGAAGLIGGKGRSSTQCCIVTSLVLCILTVCISIGDLVFLGIIIARRPYFILFWVEIFCIGLFLIELVVGFVQVVYAIRASCCCLTAAPAVNPMVGAQPMTVFTAQTVTVNDQPPNYGSKY